MRRKNFILMFDIDREDVSLRKKINRKLHKVNAERIQHSVWKSNNLSDLTQIASTIKQEGGQVTILKEEIITI